MATNGQINTNTSYDSYFWVKWSQSGDQDIANNRTLITWSCGVYCGHNFYNNAIKMSAVSINGVQVYGGGTYSNYSKGNHTIASGNMWINHNTNGTKTFGISAFTGWLYSSYNYSSNGGSYDLTTIPRQATITAAADFTDVGNPSISFSNPGGFPMDVWIEPNPVGDHLCVRTGIPNTGSYTWVLTDEEREALRSKCPGGLCTIRLGLYTYIGDATYADYKDKIYTMTESAATKPSVRMEISLNNGELPSTFDDMCIQGVSRVDVTLSGEGKYGADIDRCYATVDGKTYNSASFTSDVIQSDQMVEIVGYAKDTRGFTNFTRDRIDVIAYSKPSVTAIAYRCNSSGEEDPEGAYMKVGFTSTISSLNGKNSADFKITYSGGAWGTPITGAGTSYTSEPIECDVSSVCNVEVSVSDKISSTTRAATIPIAFTLIDYYNTGEGVAFGKVATRDGFDCAMDAYFSGNVTVKDKLLVDLIYPVGSIYISTNNLSPQGFFGGTWERIKDVFLLAAGNTYTAGGTGGAATHTLTTNEMPVHYHDGISVDEYYNTHRMVYDNQAAVGDGNSAYWSINAGTATNARTARTVDAGGGQAHNNMPPYLAVYMWKRTT